MIPFSIDIDGKTIKGEFTNLSSAAGGFYTFQILINKYFIGNLEFKDDEWKFQSYNNKRFPKISESELAQKIGEVIAISHG